MLGNCMFSDKSYSGFFFFSSHSESFINKLMSPRGASHHGGSPFPWSFLFFYHLLLKFSSSFCPPSMPFFVESESKSKLPFFFFFPLERNELAAWHPACPGTKTKKKEVRTDLRMNLGEQENPGFLNPAKQLWRLPFRKKVPGGSFVHALFMHSVSNPSQRTWLCEAFMGWEGIEKWNTSLLAAKNLESVRHTQAKVKSKFCYLVIPAFFFFFNNKKCGRLL